MFQIKVDRVYSRVIGDTWEISEVSSRLLPPPNKKGEPASSLISGDGMFLTGLLPIVQKMFECEVEYLYENDVYRPQDKLLSGLVEGIELRDYQLMSVRKMLLQGRGLLELPTGGGKTETSIALTNFYLSKGYRTLFVCGSSYLTQQSQARYISRGVKDTGILYGDEYDSRHKVVCATVQTLYSMIKRGDPEVDRLLQYEVIIADEVHHLPSMVWKTVMRYSQAVHRFGMSATIYSNLSGYTERDFHLIGLTGPIIMRLPMYILVQRGYLSKPLVYLKKINEGECSKFEWDPVYKTSIVHNETRNDFFTEVVEKLHSIGRKSLTFVSHTDTHGMDLLLRYSRFCPEAILTAGSGRVYRVIGGEVSEEKWTIKDVQAYVAEHTGLSVVSTPVLNEGVDIPSFGAVVLAAGGKNPRQVTQRIGRGMRKEEEGDELWIFDCVDLQHPFTKKHSLDRIELYRKERIPMNWIEDCPLWS